MALVDVDREGNYITPCALCGQPLELPIFATSHFIGNPLHKLFPFSDAAMHWRCYAQWEHRPEFARLHFRSKVEGVAWNPLWGIAYIDKRVMVSANPTWESGEIDVQLRLTGSGIRVKVDDWERWVNGDWVRSSHHELEHQALAEVIETLRTELPTGELVIQKASGGLNFDPSSVLGPRSLTTNDILQYLAMGRVMERDKFLAELSAPLPAIVDACLHPAKMTPSQCNSIFDIANRVFVKRK